MSINIKLLQAIQALTDLGTELEHYARITTELEQDCAKLVKERDKTNELLETASMEVDASRERITELEELVSANNKELETRNNMIAELNEKLRGTSKITKKPKDVITCYFGYDTPKVNSTIVPVRQISGSNYEILNRGDKFYNQDSDKGLVNWENVIKVEAIPYDADLAAWFMTNGLPDFPYKYTIMFMDQAVKTRYAQLMETAGMLYQQGTLIS